MRGSRNDFAPRPRDVAQPVYLPPTWMSEAVLTPEEAEAPESLLGTLLDERYRIDAVLGEGGIGCVYRGTLTRLERPVAIKVLHDRHQGKIAIRQRFAREALALAALDHPNIVSVHDYGTDGGLLYLVMELIDGVELADRIAEGPLEPFAALGIVRQLLRSLAYAHDRGLVHRDLKPGNVMIRPLGDGAFHSTVLDFGLAKFVADDTNDEKLTQSGHVLGTPAYMSPEQAAGEQVDARSDVFALGMIAAELLTGVRPLGDLDGAERMKRLLLEPMPALSTLTGESAFATELEVFVARCLATRRDDRFRDGRDALLAFQNLPVEPVVPRSTDRLPTRMSGPGTVPATQRMPARPWAFALGGVLVGAALGAGATLAIGGPDEASAVASDASGPDTVSPLAANQIWTRGASPDARVPAGLVPLHRRIAAGQQPSRTELRPIYRYAQDHPHDPFPHLMLGRTYTSRRWFSDALESYERALAEDPSVANEPQMRQDVLKMATVESVSPRAIALAVRAYGAELVPTLDEYLEDIENRARRARLEALRARLLAN